MKAVKILAIVLILYVGIVVAFESMLGFFQPQAGTTLVITTTDKQGMAHDRVVSRLDSNGALYVAANHWPRAWYRQALQNPHVQATLNGAKIAFVAVPVTGAEDQRIESEHPHGIGFRLLTGFPPRHFLRLDPEVAAPTVNE